MNFKKARGLLGLVGSVFGAVSAVQGFRNARKDKDKLLLVNASASILVAITGVLLTIRSIRKDELK
ncbi:hypothetical protein LWC34_34325 [Kibdelosporangium philippinense]|uniref:Uncharacterized protein n=1 Tax=Kibdelosporangium philippinense TaxID=211113 RepID=A0ABS8ZJ96_9PSEU|nr:hypothetical protein [Kibdelosporangium philippinense]MCE7007861.1 hypothetical protein [Kibdelosporangium philippinense]